MLCEKYKPALIEAAVSGAELEPAVRAHAESCANCAAELAQQRSLVDAIDASLHRQMNASIPAATLQRLGAHIAQQKPRRSLNLRWLYATAALAATAAAILFAVTHLRTHKPDSRTAAVTQSTQSPAEHRPERMNAILQPATPQEMERDRRQHARSSARSEPEVLVPPDERIAMEHFIADLHGRGEIALALAKRLPEQREKDVAPVETPDIQISSLTVPAIRESDTRSDN
jgi:hypothetical protein